MAKAYLIGGTPRVGKTTLTLGVIKQLPILAASTDAIRYTLRQVINPEEKPDLFHLGKFTSNDPEYMTNLKSNPDEVIKIQNNESLIVWKSVVDFIHSNIEDGFDVLIEGIAVLPSQLHELQCDYNAVFLGNQSSNHFDTILKSARSNPNDWMHELENETVEAFSVFNQRYSAFLEHECAKFNLEYTEVRDTNFTQDIESALNLLLSK